MVTTEKISFKKRKESKCINAKKKASNNKERQQLWKKGTKELQNIQKIIIKMTIVGPCSSIIIVSVN